jgi:hypothetical protein
MAKKMRRLLDELKTGRIKRLRALDAIKTYRYLRIGMIGAVVLLGVSILLESSRAHNAVTNAEWCLQDSISAYYFTPVRAIFVASLFIVGFALIAYKGHNVWEDFLLNIAGMFAPIVAIVPTTTVGDCWSIEPSPPPVTGGSLANWVVTNIDNNIDALLIIGSLAVLVAFVIWLVTKQDPDRLDEIQPGTGWLLSATALGLLAAWLLKFYGRDFFLANAHGKAAILFFVFLWLAIITSIVQHWSAPSRPYGAWYIVIAVAMVVGIPVSLLFGDHQILVLEAWEIIAFATYWIVQTVENWDEKVITPKDDDLHVELTQSSAPASVKADSNVIERGGASSS